ncbi:MAG: hypothetical protein CR986_00215 [Ignavibacteriae bacterium]|nr:MAG: hypothetical protein CR986_00215 [Ignavibacteriota bacterium]
MKIKNKIILLIWFCISVSIHAQYFKDSLNFSYSKYFSDNFITSFNKRLNIYNLNNQLSYSVKYNKFFFGIYENYLSSLVTTNEKNIQDEQSLSILSEFNYSPFLKFGMLAQNNIYSNDRKITINKASNIYTTLYAKIYPISQLKITPYGGYTINNQVSEEDDGVIYGGNIDLENLNLNNFLINSNLKFQNEDIAPRKNTQRVGELNVRNEFENNITNIFSANYTNVRKDFYLETDSLTARTFNISKNIQSRTEERYNFLERIYNSKFASDFSFDLSAGLFYRNIIRDFKYNSPTNFFNTEIEELILNLKGTTEYRSKYFFGSLSVDYNEKEEKHFLKENENINPIFYQQKFQQEKRKNNTSEYASISGLGNISLSSSDNIAFSIFYRKLVYNTPSEDNFDDRDEVLTIAKISYFKKVNHLFNFYINLEGSFNHLVYIFAERSSNNNIRRVLKLSSGGTFRRGTFYSKNSFVVSANYTSYDFNSIQLNLTSFSFRQFSASDSTSFKLLNSLYLDFKGYIKLSEQGNFNWKKFSGNPNRFLEEFYFEPILFVKKDNLKFGSGLRFFSLRTYNYKEFNSKNLFNEYVSIGPIFNCEFNLPNLTLYLNGWYEFITIESAKAKELANVFFTVNWNL